MHKYRLSYSVYDPTKPAEIKHEDYEFQSDAEILGAADDGMCEIFDRYEKDKPTEVLFRKIELLNPKEVYRTIIQQAKERANG